MSPRQPLAPTPRRSWWKFWAKRPTPPPEPDPDGFSQLEMEFDAVAGAYVMFSDVIVKNDPFRRKQTL
jgi:hypothetical protein